VSCLGAVGVSYGDAIVSGVATTLSADETPFPAGYILRYPHSASMYLTPDFLDRFRKSTQVPFVLNLELLKREASCVSSFTRTYFLFREHLHRLACQVPTRHSRSRDCLCMQGLNYVIHPVTRTGPSPDSRPSDSL
jgi:hypothetical protein